MSKLKGKKDIKMTIFIIVVGVSLIVVGIYGVVSSRVESRDYKNTTDIRKLSAVIDDFSTSDTKDDLGDVKYTTYKFKVSYVVDGKTYKGKYEERAWSSNPTKMYTYDKLRKGDKILVEVYKNSKGQYKLAPEGNPVDFLLYCAAIPVGIVISAVMAYDMLRKKSGKQNIGKATKSKGRKADR